MAKYFNRELSWLEFNHRVLQQALDPSVPLLERLKFLSITGSNLDEFFMVRVGGLQTLAAEGVRKRDPAGLTPARQLHLIEERVRKMVGDQYACLRQLFDSLLPENGIVRTRPEDVTEAQRQYIQRYYETEVMPVISPMAIGQAHRKPLLMNLSLHLALRIRQEKGRRKYRTAVIPVGRYLDRFVMLPAESGFHFMLIEDVVQIHAATMFPGERVVECVPFRITRNADLAVREDDAPDLLAQMEKVLDARKESHCVRLEVEARISRTLLRQLQKMLQPHQTYEIPGPLNLSTLMSMTSLEGWEELKNERWNPSLPPFLKQPQSMFEILSRRDVLLYHPFDSFDPVLRLIEQASTDPDVVAIKQILYRTSRTSPIVRALAAAAESGKYVTALVELKARFDEARNIEWARFLEQSGVQVIYGVRGLKTHAKLLIIVRREAQGMVRYVHTGTGNYNESTARLYTDVGYMTSNDDLGIDASSFFNALTGYSQLPRLSLLSAAPIGIRQTVLELIDAEIERKRHGQKAHIMAKMNSLVDPAIIKALYRASSEGVKIELNVRGICCLRPGVSKLSENIRVISIVDRLLEHSRVFYFHHGGARKIFISSADWMPRNLDKRTELMVPVLDAECRDHLISILRTCMKDTAKSHELTADGTYVRTAASGKHKPCRSQEALYHQSRKASRLSRAEDRTVFQPHRPSKSRKGRKG